jgi:uncharacterized protein
MITTAQPHIARQNGRANGLDAGIRILAQTITPASVRSLDAIHLATALRVRGQLTSFVTYDERLADADAAAGLRVDMPTA